MEFEIPREAKELTDFYIDLIRSPMTTLAP